VKDFFVYRIALRLALPFIVVVCVLVGGTTPALAGKTASVQIGFLGTQPFSDPILKTPIPFQNVLLNVIAVRINPHANAAPSSGSWQKIPVPPGIGGSNSLGELQIDLNSSQNVPQLFNTAKVRTGNYRIVQLLLDPTNPGSLIPNCPGPSADGCINYPIQLINGNGITLSALKGAPPLITTTTGALTSFVVQVSMMINKFPASPGGAFTVTISLLPVSNPATGTIKGTVNVDTSMGTPPGGKVRKLMVAAETIGTNTVIASAPVKTGQPFTLILPAAGPPAQLTPFGTLYDLTVSGGAATYAALRLPPLFPSAFMNMTNFAVTGNQMLGDITGTVSDGCVASKAISSATLQLLIPPDNIVKPPANFCLPTVANPTANLQCISVATANTDTTGAFPLPGTVTTPTAFANVPILPKKASYVMEVTAPGYDPLFVLAQPGNGTNKKGGGTCSLDQGNTFKACNLQMATGYIAGAFPIVAPNPGQTALVEVLAEDHDTNNIESALPRPITVSSNQNVTNCFPPGTPPDGIVCANFSLNVPPSIPIGAFDLFAATIDTYQGVTDPYQGHSIVAISDVRAPAACATMTITTPSDPNQVISCVGHGSITGSVGTPNLGASVVLEKLDPEGPPNDNEVQITNSIIQNQSLTDVPATATNRYSFCAPADTYQLQEFQLPQPTPGVVPTAMPSPSPVFDGNATVTIPPPPPAGGPSTTTTPTPAIKCPTNCSHSDGTCPGICNNAIPDPPLPPLPTLVPMATPTMTPTSTPTP
jgi:hypothetical protein